MKTNKTCEIKGHKDIKPMRICVLKECDQITRWLCYKCINEKIHLHNQLTENHIVTQQDFIKEIEQNQKIWNANLRQESQRIQFLLSKFNYILDLVRQGISYLETKYQSFQKINQALINKSTDQYLAVDKLYIDEYIIFKQRGIQFNSEHSEQILLTIINQISDLQQIFSIVDQKQTVNKSIIQQQSKILQFEDYFDCRETQFMYTFQISPDEQLIAFGGNNNKLTLINLNTKQIVQVIKFQFAVSSCKFTNDSQLIYCGTKKGFLYAYDIRNSYEEIFKYKVHEYHIFDIKFISNTQVATCSFDRCIIIFDIKNNQELLKIPKAHPDKIFQIEYDSINHVIISGSCDNSIKFFLANNGKLVINQKKAHYHPIYQIQLNNNNKNLFSKSESELRQWQINYQHKSLKLIRKFIQIQPFYSFALLPNHNIMLLYSKYIKVLDNNHKNILEHNHEIDEQWYIRYSNQTNSMRFLLIMGTNQVKVIKRQI